MAKRKNGIPHYRRKYRNIFEIVLIHNPRVTLGKTRHGLVIRRIGLAKLRNGLAITSTIIAKSRNDLAKTRNGLAKTRNGLVVSKSGLPKQEMTWRKLAENSLAKLEMAW